ncbi:MAG: hypothetical protein JWP02_1236 [Acidimicrobiales bacterium]|nr:hypothetical protein [Acidimicrobiales bacterium]
MSSFGTPLRRLLVAFVAVTAAASMAGPVTGASAATNNVATAPSPAAGNDGTEAAQGRSFLGLRPAADSEPCRHRFVAVRSGTCTHGPDPAPPGVDVRVRRPTVAADTASGTTAAGSTNAPCYGDGSSGMRVQAIYAHASNVSDRYSQVAGSIRQWAAAADSVFNASAQETGGVRHIRFVTDSSCTMVVPDVTLSSAGDDSIDNTISELRSQGYNRTDRKYLVWTDANVYCGIAQVYGDDSSGASNASNGNTSVPGEVARVDSGCWGLSGQSIEAHELLHTLGGVQASAPHSTPNGHCWDESDRMCYADGSGPAMSQVCPTSHENLFDCNHDDYFSTNPPKNSYLATHWNTANSAFLANADPPPPSPPGPAPSPPGASAVTSGGYVLDDWGGIHPFAVGSNALPPRPSGGPYWPGQDVVRGMTLVPNGTGGYVVDDWGGIHPFAVGASSAPQAPSGGPYWKGQDVARGIAVLPNGTSGYVLDSWGGIHPFGGAPGVVASGYWPGQNVARGIALLPNGTGGYVVDDWGGIHPFAVGSNAMPPATKGGPYWMGQDVVRGIAMLSGGTGGYVVDDWAGIHAYAVGANALPPAATGGPYWAGQDVVRGIAAA